MKASRFPAAALFDLNGVLLDTEPVYTRIWSDIERVYPTGIDNFALKIKGNTLPRILNTYFPDPDVQAAVKAMLAEREEAMEYPVFDGVMDFLEGLRRLHIPAAIVTSSGDAKMQRIARKEPEFMAMFRALVTDSCVTHSKPHPEPYLKGAEALGPTPRAASCSKIPSPASTPATPQAAPLWPSPPPTAARASRAAPL